MPKTQKEVRIFLGRTGSYRKFITNYAKIEKSMTKALKKKERIDPEDKDYKETFEKLKELITNAPVLAYPDFTKPFTIKTDASNLAIGAVFSQE